jgi:hypothetical protein
LQWHGKHIHLEMNKHKTMEELLKVILFLSDIYIYIYIYVCVCVCVRAHTRACGGGDLALQVWEG